MSDMLVHLLKLPDAREDIERLRGEGIIIRRARPLERSVVRRYVLSKWSELWADEADTAFSAKPPTIFIATHEKRIIGFGCYETTCRGFFGPTGVNEEYRGKGIGRVLLIECLRSMREMGYAYAIIGGVGPVDFYSKCVGAILIPDSTPGIYWDMLERNP
ncbi:MAG: GNAT family N-acetyltransferase [Armatimonadota bacterium]|nr:GNAT family N-acetyltransferase [Armatimonadota bacterium]